MQDIPVDAKWRVLVAMSDRAIQYQCSSRLADEGFNVANVSDACACLDALRCGRCDILVVEKQLAVGRDPGVVELMDNDPDIKTIPAVIVELPAKSKRNCVRREHDPFAMEELVQLIKNRLLNEAL